MSFHPRGTGVTPGLTVNVARRAKRDWKDLVSCNEDQRSPMLQLGLGAAKQID